MAPYYLEYYLSILIINSDSIHRLFSSQSFHMGERIRNLHMLTQFSNRTEEEKQLILQIIKNTLKLRDLPDKTI